MATINADERRSCMIAPDALEQIDKLLGPRGYLDRPEDLKLYEYDGSVDKAQPELVVFPQIDRGRGGAGSNRARASHSRSSAGARAPD